jgi:hypothetical protein
MSIKMELGLDFNSGMRRMNYWATQVKQLPFPDILHVREEQ